MKKKFCDLDGLGFECPIGLKQSCCVTCDGQPCGGYGK